MSIVKVCCWRFLRVSNIFWPLFVTSAYGLYAKEKDDIRIFKRCYLRICSLLRSSTLSTKVVKYCLTWKKFINTYDDYALCWLLYTCIGVPEAWQGNVRFVLKVIYDTTLAEKGQGRGIADKVATKTNNYRNCMQLFPVFRLYQLSGHVKGNMGTLMLSEEARCFPL